MNRIVLTLAACMISLPAAAHDGHATATGFAAGLAHPFLGADHLLAMFGIGIWSRRQEQPLALPLAFLALMAVGAMLQGGLVVGEAAILASLGAIGLLLAARVSKWSAVAMVGLFGVLHGQVHGHELPGVASAAGSLSASAALLGAGLVVGRFQRWPRPLVDSNR